MGGKNKKYSSKFNHDWLKIDKYKCWLRSVETCDTLAFCKFCNTQFDVGSMRIGALSSHSAGAKHKAKASPHNSDVPKILNFFKNKKKPVPTEESDTSSDKKVN